jgi:hypothetical protein
VRMFRKKAHFFIGFILLMVFLYTTHTFELKETLQLLRTDHGVDTNRLAPRNTATASLLIV